MMILLYFMFIHQKASSVVFVHTIAWLAMNCSKLAVSRFMRISWNTVGPITEEQRSAIKIVSADGARWITSCIEEFCPNAVRCIDPFHVVEWVNEALSKVRIESWNDAKKNAAPTPLRKVGRPPKGSAPKDKTASEIKGSKYALGKNLGKSNLIIG